MVLLSFDVEEFDMPFEYGKTISFEEQISISVIGTEKILALLKKHSVLATFFCTATFALNAPQLIKKMVNQGHEIASHAYYHSKFNEEDFLKSRLALEQISGVNVSGFRMPRMMPVDHAATQKAGYRYNSSINPTWLPGRYNNWSMPRTLFEQAGVLQLPASVSPMFRIPLFWLSFHNFPLWIYKKLCIKTHQADNYLNLYFHPWEFTDLKNFNKFGFPGYVSKNSGEKMVLRMESLIDFFKKNNIAFSTIKEFLKNK